MKIKTLAVAAGVSAPLILGGVVSGGFVGVECCTKPNPFGLLTVNLYAIFDRSGQDQMILVAGTVNAPMLIEVIGGTFYQHPFGTDRPPVRSFIGLFPSLAYDSFVSIGKKDDNGDSTGLLPFWPGFGMSVLSTIESGWVVLPDAPQGDPFHPDTFPGNGRVLIGQFSTANGTAIQGTMLMQYISNDGTALSINSFLCDNTVGCNSLGCQSDEQCSDDDPCNGIEVCVDGVCQPGEIPDCNGNGIHDACDIANGTSTDADGDGVPDGCVVCQSDLDGDNTVGIVDFLLLLGDWGVCP